MLTNTRTVTGRSVRVHESLVWGWGGLMVMLIAKRVPSIEQAVLSRLWVAGGGVLLDHDLPGCRGRGKWQMQMVSWIRIG